MKKKEGIKPNKRAKIADTEFVHRLEDLSGNFSALGRELGISHTAVRKRFARIKKGAHQKGAQNGETATVVLMEEARRGFPDGVQGAMKKVGTLERLESLYSLLEQQISGLEEILKADVARGKSRVLKSHLTKSLVVLVRESRGLITDSFQIKRDLFRMESVAAFIDAVIRTMEKHDPEIQRKIYQELCLLGNEDQLLGLRPLNSRDGG